MKRLPLLVAVLSVGCATDDVEIRLRSGQRPSVRYLRASNGC